MDGTKISWYGDRVRAWARGEHIAPITVDIALTRSCNYHCEYCYGLLQENTYHKITKAHITSFLDDCAEMGVKGVSLVSDGESSISRAFEHTIIHGSKLGLSMASGTNGYLVNKGLLESILPHLTYLRFNVSGGERDRYNQIMGASGDMFDVVCRNIQDGVEIKRKQGLKCSIGMQMVFMPKYEDQLIPLARLAIDLGVDYLIIKHCSDDEFGTLGVDYGGYNATYQTLKKAEALSTDRTLIRVKWSKLNECSSQGAVRSYQRCYGPPFILQISGTGLVAPCGMLFNDRYSRYHMGNIVEKSFKSIWESDHYWEIVRELASSRFDARKMCGSLCLQHSVNKYLDEYMKGTRKLEQPKGDLPLHGAFI